MTDEQAKALRAPFPPEQVGKLPKPTKKDNPRGHCDFCGGYHGLPAVHLDYVGHAAVTDRLLAVDPEWTWEPAAVGPNGEPLSTDNGLWIKLTVAGVTRYGFGDSSMGHGPKEAIGDAIRNAAMRFGVGLDLWAKEDLHAEEKPEPAKADDTRSDAQNKKLNAVIGELNKSVLDPPDAEDWKAYSKKWTFTHTGKGSSTELTKGECGQLIDHLEEFKASIPAAEPF